MMDTASTDTPKERNIVKRLILWMVAIAGLLTIPLLAKFPWTVGDFILAGTVLFSAALGYEIATKGLKDFRSRFIIGVVVLLMVLFVWAMAVVD